VRLGDCLPPNHLARFVVDRVAQLDLEVAYAKYGSRGGEPYAPAHAAGLVAVWLCHRGVQLAEDRARYI
jgi:hypothetical protein